jgi:TRAP-type C4-dicarboxylate transport system permease small subunit
LNSKDGWFVGMAALISRALLAISGVMILVMTFTATYGVVRRYLLHNPEPYSYELGMMMLLWCYVLSVAEVQKQERHLRGDFILSRLPQGFQYFISRILTPMLAVFCSAMLAWKGWDAALFSLRIGERSISSWSEPLFPVKIMIPAGYAVLFVVAIVQLLQGIFAPVKTKR